jgi:hypothetical protein
MRLSIFNCWNVDSNDLTLLKVFFYQKVHLKELGIPLKQTRSLEFLNLVSTFSKILLNVFDWAERPVL